MNKQILIRSLIVATALFAVTMILGSLVPLDTFLEMGQELGDLLGPLLEANPFLLFSLIFLNNAVKTLAVIGLGILIGIPPVFFISMNGLVIGSVISWVKSLEGLGYTIAAIAPHGVIEIPIMLLATALSLMVGWESLNWIRRRESSVKSQLSVSLKLYLKVILPGLAAAAAIETFVTPWVVSMVAGG